MKFILFASIVISGSALAYHNGTNTNQPVREPASVVKEIAQPTPVKVAPKQ